MTSGILALPTVGSDVTTASTNAVVPATASKAGSGAGDSVHLSPAAQQAINPKDSSTEAADAHRSMVEQLVEAAAAGDVGALALLTVA